MKKIMGMVALGLGLAVVAPAYAAEPNTDKAPTTAGTETSDRTPGKKTTTPPAQVDTTTDGKTSNRGGDSGAGSGSGDGTSSSDKPASPGKY